MDFIHWLQGSASPVFDQFWGFISDLNGGEFGILIVAITFWCVNTWTGWLFGNIIIASVIVNETLKVIIGEARPSAAEVRVIREDTAPGTSFPSGHTQFATVFWGYLAWLSKRPLVWVLCAVMVILTGLSRLYLGLHWPHDILGAIVVGGVLLVGGIWITRKWFETEPHPMHPALRLAFLIVPIVAFALLPNKNMATAAGVGLGTNLGFLWILPRHIRTFPVRVGLKWQIVKIVIGIAGIFIVRLAIKPLLPDSALSDFIRYSLVGLWIGWLAPFVFTLIVKETPVPVAPTA
jgi:membrane-associated phospholipid phosphatase